MNQRYKYPRTPYLPWSPGAGNDDIHIADLQHFVGQKIVVTEKLDGENTTLYTDYLHARSIDGRHHPSRNWVKNFHATIAHSIPTGWRLCGENLYARHAIAYDELRSYFYLFSIWDETNQCLSWPATLEWAELLAIRVPTTFYHGPWDEARLRELHFDTNKVEGYVVRNANAFAYADFSHNVAKWVRRGHVQTNEHWMHGPIVPNQLARAATIQASAG